MKKITLLFLFMFFIGTAYGQVLSEGFDTPGSIPAGWTQVSVSGDATWTSNASNQNGSVTPRTGPGMAYFYEGNYNGEMARLETPSMDLTTLTSPVLTFYYTQEDWGGDQDELRIFYKTSAAGTWTELAAYTDDTNAVWTEVNLILPSASNDYYIGFEGTSGWGRGVTVDDVVVAEAPSCLAPGGLNVTPNSITDATLGWTPAGSETDFTYEYGATGFSLGSGLGSGNISANSAGINGLTAGDTYDFYVQANCGADGDSGFTGPFTWTQPNLGGACTVAIPVTLESACSSATPITLDFNNAESNVSTACDTFDNFGYWLTVTTDANGGITVNTTGVVDLAIYDTCGGTEIACVNDDISPSASYVLSPNTQYYLYLWNESGNTSSIDVCIETYSPAPAPNCAEAPIFPLDGAIDVEATDAFTLSWTAPSSGPAPTSYNVYVGSAPGSLTLFANVVAPDTTIDSTVGAYDTTIYWQVLPVNDVTEATGCDIWSFTSESAPPPPANDDCSGSIVLTPGSVFTDNPVVGRTESATASEVADPSIPVPGCSSYVGGDMWYSVIIPADGNLTIETQGSPVGNGGDSGMAVYSGTCGALVLVDCDDDSSGDGFFSRVVIADPALANQTVYLRVFEFGNNAILDFQISAFSDTLSTNSFDVNGFEYFPNPVNDKLSLRAQNNIQNVSIYNILGQEVVRTAPNAVSGDIDMSQLNNGAYFVKVTINDKTETIKIIKK